MCFYVSALTQCFNYKIGILKPHCQFSSEFIYFLAWKPLLIWTKGTFEEMSLSKQTRTPPLGEIHRFLPGFFAHMSAMDMRAHWGFLCQMNDMTLCWPFFCAGLSNSVITCVHSLFSLFSPNTLKHRDDTQLIFTLPCGHSAGNVTQTLNVTVKLFWVAGEVYFSLSNHLYTRDDENLSL